MSFPHPTPEEEDQLERTCPECKVAVDVWCIGTDGKTRSILHSARQPLVKITRTRKSNEMTLGDRPEERGARALEIPNSGARWGKSTVLDVACKECGNPAAYEVREPDRMALACPLHLFSTIAAYLLGNNVVAVSMINKKAKNADRRAAVELAVQT